VSAREREGRAALQLAIHVGDEKAGYRAGVLAGVLLILPGQYS
jgi:chromate transport protein ChrA